MKKTIIILAIVLIASVTKTQAQSEPKLYSWGGQLSVSGTHLPEGEFGYFAEVEGMYKQIKPDVCVCTETEPFSVVTIVGAGIPMGSLHLKLGGGVQFGKMTNVPVAMMGIEHSYFEIGVATFFDKTQQSYEFSGTYYPSSYTGIGFAWDTKFAIPIAKIVIRFPISFRKGGCGGCAAYNR